MSIVDLTADYSSAPYRPKPPEPDPFANWTEPAGSPTTANYSAWGAPAPTGTPTPQPAYSPQPQRTYNYEYDTWQDESGRLWDRSSGLWYSLTDPQNPLVYRPQVGWQTPAQYNDYNSVLNEFGDFAQNPVVAQPSAFATPTMPRQLSSGEWQDVQQWAERRSPSPTADWYNLDAARDPFRGTGVGPLNPDEIARMAAEGGETIDRTSLRQTDPLGPGYKPDVRFQTGGGMLGNPLSAILGPAYSAYDKYLAKPVEETLAQMTPAALSLAKYGIPGGQQAFGLGELATGYNPDKNVLPGLRELGTAAKESGGNPLAFGELQRENFAERPAWQQMGAEALYDPMNLLGAGIGSKALASGALEGGGTLSAILRGAAKVDKGIDAAQAAVLSPLAKVVGKAAQPIGTILKAGETGEMRLGRTAALSHGLGKAGKEFETEQFFRGFDKARGALPQDGPVFLTPDPSGAQEYAAMRGATGRVGQFTPNIQNPADDDALWKVIADAGGDDVVSARIREVSPYDGENLPVDALYVPEIRNALEAAGYDGYAGWDVLFNDQIPVAVAFSPAQVQGYSRGRIGTILSGEGGAVPLGLAARAGLGAAAGGATYALSDEDDPRQRLLKSLAVGLGVAVAPDVARKAGKAIPKRAKTGWSPAIELATLEPLPLGDSGIVRALERKEATTSRAGKIGEALGKLPGAKATAGAFNPSINLDRSVHVANQASAAVQADLGTKFASTRKPLAAQVEDAFGKFTKGDDGYFRPERPPAYSGPPERTIAGTIVDMLENPHDYDLDALQKATLDLWELRDAQNVNLLRTQYGSEIGIFTPETGGKYAPHINTNHDLIQQGLTTEARMRNPAITKARSYETAAERMANAPDFIPETDPLRLLELHDNQLARMGGNQTFKQGVGGKTRVEVLELTRPELVKAKKDARAYLDSLKGRMERRLQKEGDLAAAIRKNLGKLQQLDDRMAPLRAKIALLEQAGDYGPELSHLSGQVYELRRQEATLERLVAGTPKKPGLSSAIVTNDKEITSLRAQVDAAQKRVEELINAYANADVTRDGFVRSDFTYRYHSPEVAESIKEVKQMSLGPVDKLVNYADVARGTALSADGSPIQVQGLMGFFRDPVSTIKAWSLMMLEGGANLDDVARREPEMVSRYVQARARALGQVSDEFDPTQSLIASIPGKVGRTFVHTENAMFNALQRVDYETWKNTRGLLARLNPGVADDVLDHEAASAISKTVPGMSNVERGVSPARAKLERGVLTSTSFLASPMAVLKDASSAVVKLAAGQRPRGREQVALAHLISTAATLSTLVGASAVATAHDRNLSPEEALKRAFNPARKEFMALQLPGGYRVPLGGPMRSFIRSMTPLDRDGNITPPRLLDWAGARLAPAPGAVFDIVRNRDFEGDSIRSGNDLSQLNDIGYYFVEQGLFPLSVGSVSETLRKGGSIQDAISEGLGAAGGNAPQAPTPTDKLDSIARAWPENEGRDFYKSPPSVQAAIKERHTKLWEEAVAEGSEQRQAAFAKEKELLAQQQASDDMLKANSITAAQWREQRGKRYDEARNFKEGVYALNDSEAAGDQRLAGFFKAIADSTGPDGSVDWDKVEGWTSTLSADDRQFIEDNTGLGLRTDKTKEYKADMKVLQDSGYWETDDKLWEMWSRQYDVGGAATAADYWIAFRQQMISRSEEILTSKYGESWRTNTPNAAVELGDVALGKAKRKYDDILAEMRKRWRAEHETEAAILAKWQMGGTGAEETIGRIVEGND